MVSISKQYAVWLINNELMSRAPNKNQITFRHPHARHFSNNLTNIDEDLELESQIRMPGILSKKQYMQSPTIKLKHHSELSRILQSNTKSTPRKSSYLTHSNNTAFHSKNMQAYSNSNIRSENLPHLAPLAEPCRNKSSLDRILADRGSFAKLYFQEISQADRKRKRQVQLEGDQDDVDFQFPEIKVGNWKVRAYLKQEHILLKGIDKDGKICIKKYQYRKVYEKVRKDYQTWVQQKFSFET